MFNNEHGRTSGDGGKFVSCCRSKDNATKISSSTSSTKLDSSKTTIIITLLLAAWLIPKVSSAASQNETRSVSSNENSTGSNSLDKQAWNVQAKPSGSLLPLSRRGDNPPAEHNSGLAVPVPTNEQDLSDSGFRNTSKDKTEKSAVSASMDPRQEGDASKIISIVVPFTCVIFVAGTLFATYKLCQRYRCYKNKADLTKCLTLCDRCMSTPHVFQLSDDKKDSSRPPSASSDSGRIFHYSFNSSSSLWVSSTSSPMGNHTQRQTRQATAAQYTPLRHSSSSSSHSSISGVAPRSPSQRLGSVNCAKQSSTQTLASNSAPTRSTAVHQGPRHPETKPRFPGYVQRPSFRLSRQSYTPGLSGASGHSRGSMQLPPQPHKVPGAISRRHNSVR